MVTKNSKFSFKYSLKLHTKVIGVIYSLLECSTACRDSPAELLILSLSMQVEYLLKKICMAMSIEFNCVELEDFFSQDSVQQSGITVWTFLEMMNSGKVTRGIDASIISMAIEEVYREIVGDVLKEVGN